RFYSGWATRYFLERLAAPDAACRRAGAGVLARDHARTALESVRCLSRGLHPAGAAARPHRGPHPGRSCAEECRAPHAHARRSPVRLPVQRHPAGRGDLFLSRHGQPHGRRGAQRRPAADPGGRAHLLHRGAGHQHRGRQPLRRAQSATAGAVMNAIARSLRSPRVLVALVLILGIGPCAVFAPWLAPHDPAEQDLLSILLPPAWATGGDPAFPLGTDSLGRCVLSRLIYGARTAMTVAVLASLGAMLIGSVLAHVTGYFGGLTDWVIGRAVDVWMSFPPVILSLILMVGLGTGLDKVILAIILVDWTRFCRVLRSEVLVVKQRDYVTAARLLGFGHWRTVTREVLP